jgi:hypothetical protein
MFGGFGGFPAGFKMPLFIHAGAPEHEVPGTAPKHMRMLWIPKRCELPGCTACATTDDVPLLTCRRCRCVLYCSRAHQYLDFPNHMKECAHLAKLGLWGKPYSLKTEASKRPPGRLAADPTPEPQCTVCSRQGRLRRTSCCNNWVCDRDDLYTGGYSRAFCNRSHERYTACGQHHSEGHKGDWRTCRTCLSEIPHIQHCSGFNVVPPLQPRTQGALLSHACSQCHGRFVKDVETWSTRYHKKKGELELCYECTSGDSPAATRRRVPGGSPVRL